MKIHTVSRPLPPMGIAMEPGAAEQPKQLQIVRTIARYSSAGNVGTFTPYFHLLNPSSRLHCAIQVGWEMDYGSDPTFSTGSPTWTLTAINRNAETGAVAILHNLFTNRSLPDGYELNSAIRAVRGKLTLHDTDISGILSEPATLIVQASWEPNESFLGSEGELRQLFNLCSLSVDSGIAQVGGAT